jgi:hypothetical protein
MSLIMLAAHCCLLPWKIDVGLKPIFGVWLHVAKIDLFIHFI